MGDCAGDKGKPQIVARCRCADFGTRRTRSRSVASNRSKAAQYICTTPIELPEAHANEALAMIDKLEQDDDVQNVYHSLVSARLRRSSPPPQPERDRERHDHESDEHHRNADAVGER
jgi:hypothetical protein